MSQVCSPCLPITLHLLLFSCVFSSLYFAPTFLLVRYRVSRTTRTCCSLFVCQRLLIRRYSFLCFSLLLFICQSVHFVSLCACSCASVSLFLCMSFCVSLSVHVFLCLAFCACSYASVSAYISLSLRLSLSVPLSTHMSLCMFVSVLLALFGSVSERSVCS